MKEFFPDRNQESEADGAPQPTLSERSQLLCIGISVVIVLCQTLTKRIKKAYVKLQPSLCCTNTALIVLENTISAII